MKIFTKSKLYTFLVGISVGVAALSVILLVMFLNGSLQELLAAGAGTGAADVNSRYWNGYDLDDDVSFSGNPSFTGTTTLATNGGRVGIGTTTPEVELEVQGDVNITGELTYVTYGCPSDMVSVGGFCIDKYEASVWSATSGGTQYGTSSDNYPCSDTGNDCSEDAANPIYARSVATTTPSNQITWFQAAQACANVGKRLCTNAEWQVAAAGTPDPDSSDPGDGSEECNIWYSDNNTADDLPSGAIEGGCAYAGDNDQSCHKTGTAASCYSNWGAYDMVGNVWEWTADWWGADSSTNGLTTNATYGSDYMYDVDPADNQGNGQNFPAASIRGGNWLGGSNAGVFALYLSDSPSISYYCIGFRCCR